MYIYIYIYIYTNTTAENCIRCSLNKIYAVVVVYATEAPRYI